MSLRECRIIELPRMVDPRGNLTFIEGERHVPFAIQRIFYLYDVPGGAWRAGHALKTCEQFIIAASGSFDVILDDGAQRERHHLNRSYYGLYIPPLIWREIDNFSSGSVCLVLASEPYAEDNYLRNYEEFRAAAGEKARGAARPEHGSPPRSRNAEREAEGGTTAGNSGSGAAEGRRCR